MNSLLNFEHEINPLFCYLSYMANRANLEPILGDWILDEDGKHTVRTPSGNCVIEILKKTSQIKIIRLNQTYDNLAVYLIQDIYTAKEFFPVLVGVLREHGFSFSQSETLASIIFGLQSKIIE